MPNFKILTRYVLVEKPPFTIKIVSASGDWWYSSLLHGIEFRVEQCTHQFLTVGHHKSEVGNGGYVNYKNDTYNGYLAKEFYIVIEGACSGNLILKEHVIKLNV